MAGSQGAGRGTLMDNNSFKAARAFVPALIVLGAGCLAGTAQAQSQGTGQSAQQPEQLQQGLQADAATDTAELRALTAQLEALKQSYAQEVRRLRELDMQLQALQSRIGRGAPGAGDQQGSLAAQPAPAGVPLQPAVAPAPQPEPTAPADAATAQSQPTEPPPGYAGTAEDAQRAQEAEMRSVEDVKQQQQALFNRRLTFENSVSYNRYDRKQLTL